MELQQARAEERPEESSSSSSSSQQQQQQQQTKEEEEEEEEREEGNIGKMLHRLLSFCGLLWASLILFYSCPVKADVAGDIKSLAQTIVTRIEGFEFGPVAINVPGLESIPGKEPVTSLEATDESLETFLQIFNKLPSNRLVGQILNDMKNLQSLVRLLGWQLDCTVRSPSGEDISATGPVSEVLASSPFTASTVTFHQLKMYLQSLAAFMDQVKPC